MILADRAEVGGWRDPAAGRRAGPRQRRALSAQDPVWLPAGGGSLGANSSPL